MWEAFELIVGIIFLIIMLVLVAKIGFMNLLRGFLAGLIFWFVVWFTFDSFSFFDRFFKCKDVYVPLAGMSKDCDYKGIPMIIGMGFGLLGAIAMRWKWDEKLDELNERLDEEERMRNE